MKVKVGPLVENVAESATACLLAMVQGNLLALTLAHWLIASRTGLLAGAVATLALAAMRDRNAWMVSLALGLATAAADYVVHPGHFGPVAMEAIVTGLIAAALSLSVGALRRAARARAGAEEVS